MIPRAETWLVRTGDGGWWWRGVTGYNVQLQIEQVASYCSGIQLTCFQQTAQLCRVVSAFDDVLPPLHESMRRWSQYAGIFPGNFADPGSDPASGRSPCRSDADG